MSSLHQGAVVHLFSILSGASWLSFFVIISEDFGASCSLMEGFMYFINLGQLCQHRLKKPT
jgi:hypothetical protein